MSASRSTRRVSSRPQIETLEIRRLLSADLTGTFTGAISPVLQTGDRNHAAIRVTNQGDASAKGKVTVDLFASSDNSSDGGVLLGSVTKQMNLKSGRGTNVNIRFDEPSTLADGQYSLVGVVDGSRIPDVNTTDPTFVAPQLVTAEQPAADLTSVMVNAPSQSIIINDGNVSPEFASVLVKNRGQIAAHGDVSVSFYLSADQTLDSGDYLAGRVSDVPVNLKPGQGKLFSDELIPANDVPAGEYFLIAVARPSAGIVQKNVKDEQGVAGRQIEVQRPLALSSANPVELPPGSTEPLPRPIDGAQQPPSTPTPTTGDSSSAPTTGDDPTGTSCDDGGQSCDDGSSDGTDCPPTDDGGGDDGSDDSQQPDQGQDDSSQDNQDNSTDDSQDNSSADNDQQDNSGQNSDDTGDQDTSTQDDSSQTGDDSSDQGDDSQDDSSQQSDSGSDDSGDSSSDDWFDTDVFAG